MNTEGRERRRERVWRWTRIYTIMYADEDYLNVKNIHMLLNKVDPFCFKKIK